MSSADGGASWSCPLPLSHHPVITMAHGGGGRLGADLVEHLFLPAFGEAGSDLVLNDAAVTDFGEGRLAFTTDSYVVDPLFFPGGSIGDLAVNGTVNDLAMAGATPLLLSTAFVIEEGLDLEILHDVATDMGRCALRAGVRLVAGDTKVIESGSRGGLFLNTSGVGMVPPGVDIEPARVRPGDVVIVSGPIGRHGTAVLSHREGIDFGTPVVSDCAPLNGLVAAMIASGADVHAMRDLTRGGLAAALCEIAAQADVGLEYVETSVPVPEGVASACGFLGLDPVEMANEGTMIALVDADDAELLLETMRSHPGGAEAVQIGAATDDHPGVVTARTAFGATRVIDRPMGEGLPRIC